MRIKTLFKRIALATVLLATAALAQTPYDDGQKALREQQWMEAAEYFEQAIRDDRDQADAALYWRAYALHKAIAGSQLHIIEGAGHAFDEPGILDRLIRETDAFAA